MVKRLCCKCLVLSSLLLRHVFAMIAMVTHTMFLSKGNKALYSVMYVWAAIKFWITWQSYVTCYLDLPTHTCNNLVVSELWVNPEKATSPITSRPHQAHSAIVVVTALNESHGDYGVNLSWWHIYNVVVALWFCYSSLRLLCSCSCVVTISTEYYSCMIHCSHGIILDKIQNQNPDMYRIDR